MTGPDPLRSLAALTGQQAPAPAEPAGQDVLVLGMIAHALAKNITWAQIGSALGWGSGRMAKKTAHALRRRAEARLRQEAVQAELERLASGA